MLSCSCSDAAGTALYLWSSDGVVVLVSVFKLGQLSFARAQNKGRRLGETVRSSYGNLEKEEEHQVQNCQ